MSRSADTPGQYWELIEQYRGKLMSQALSILGSHADAEDVVQETFVKAYRDREKLPKVESIGAWMLAINRCNALNRLRSRRRDSSRNERRAHELPGRSVTTGGFSGIEMREALTKVIETLPPSLRAVVVLRYWEHLSYEEIAQRLKIPQGTVGYLLYDASMQLYEKLKVQPHAAPPPEAEGAAQGDPP